MVSVARTVALVASAEDRIERGHIRDAESASALAFPDFMVKIGEKPPPAEDAARFRRY